MIVAIVGPTASGKSQLGLSLAADLAGEVICADSRTLYRELDIGTAKPTLDERSRVPHHMLDVRAVGEQMSVVDFRDATEIVMADIQQRGKTPLLVGGSGLYIDSILYNYRFPKPADEGMREQLQDMSDDALVELLAIVDPEAIDYIDLGNRRRVIRAIESAGSSRSKSAHMRSDVAVIGLTMSKDTARARIEERARYMIEAGFLDEVERLGRKYGWDSPVFAIIGYKAMKDVVTGTKSVEQGIADFVVGDLGLYKKQMTWFKRNSAIHWIDSDTSLDVTADAVDYLHDFGSGKLNARSPQ